MSKKTALKQSKIRAVKIGDFKRQQAVVNSVNETFSERGETVLMLGADPNEFALAIVGVVFEPRPAVVYLKSKILKIMMDDNDWSVDEAEEWFEYNTVRGVEYQPADTNPPIIIYDLAL
jgi:hypothetical protein